MHLIEKSTQQILAGEDLQFDEALELAKQTDPMDLYRAADMIRREFHQNSFDLCSIVNAKSGKCTEDCKFCAQSLHHDVDVEVYDVVDIDWALMLAKENEKHGVKRFSLVTAGRTMSRGNIAKLKGIYQRLRNETSLSLCASMGFLSREKVQDLKNIGVTRCHCNLETCQSFFPQVCTTHTWEEKAATIKIAQDAGLEICSGGIIGMGESFAQRLELAFELRMLGILSIPINILTPIENTPLADNKPLGITEVLRCIAMFRLINPKAVIRLAGGRNILGDSQSKCFTAGANGAMVGNYLTTMGNNLDEDIAMFRELGFAMVDERK